ncbi:MAG: LamG domain-containing protein [Candidatus Paceibacterota bacterium]
MDVLTTKKFIQVFLVSVFVVLSVVVLVPKAHAGILYSPQNNLGLVGYWNFEDGSGTTVTDQSGNGNTGTLTGTPDWVNGHRGTALDFNGSSDYVDTPAQDFGGPVTIALWVYRGPYVTERMAFGQFGSIDLRETSTQLRFITPDLSDTLIGTNVSIGEWTHLAFTYDSGTGQKIIYKNGSVAGTETSITGEIDGGTSNFQIGARGDGNQHFNGKVDEFRIYDRALSATEVAALYNAGGSKNTAPNNLGLVGYWSFNDGDGTGVSDSSGNGHNGTITQSGGLPAYINAGKLGAGISFDGAGGTISFGSATTLDNIEEQGGGITTSFWIKPGRATYGIFGKASSAPNTSNGTWRISSASLKMQFQKSYSTTVLHRRTSLDLKEDEWNHVIVIWDGTANASGVSIYINGVEGSYSVSTDGVGTKVSDASNNLNMNFGGGKIQGPLDELRLYNRILSANEIAALYSAGVARINASTVGRGVTDGLVGHWTFDGQDLTTTTSTDRSGNGNDGILQNDVKPAIGKLGQGLKFDGLNNYVRIPNSASLNPSYITVAAWIKTDATGTYQQIIDKDNTSDKRVWQFRVTNSNKVEFIPFNASTNGSKVGDITVTDGVWHHVAGTWDGSDIKVYIDGVQDGSGSSFSGSLRTGQTNNIAIGQLSGGQGNTFNGTIDDARIYNRALSASEIDQLYKLGEGR